MDEKITIGPSTMLFPMPAVLVGAVVNGRANFMTVAWCGIASMNPPSISLAIRKERHTLIGINEKREFSVNVPSADMAKKVDFCGIYSGSSHDKSGLFTSFYGELAGAPLVAECPVNLECSLEHMLDLGSHFLVVGQIRQTHVSKSCIDGKSIDPARVDPLVYTGGTHVYQRLGEVVGKAFSMGKE